jgi:hypothetical protein
VYNFDHKKTEKEFHIQEVICEEECNPKIWNIIHLHARNLMRIISSLWSVMLKEKSMVVSD